jgi:hypothetical protein
MKKTIGFAVAACAALLALAACSSSSSGNGSSVPTCKNPMSSGAGSATCNSCLQSKCSSQIANVETSCQAYVSCYSGCDCSDTNCLLTCAQTKIDATCQNAAAPEGMCLQQNCSNECTVVIMVDAGGNPG